MKPRIFIASSTDTRKVAEAFHQDLSTMADCVTWTQGAFPASSHSLDSLLNNVNDNDFGVFVFGADDDLTLRTDKPAKHFKCTRDNVVFEAGLFMGRYGKHNVFIVYPDTCKALRIPTDLDGFTRVAYSPEHPAGLSAGVGAACIKIRDAIEKFGVARQLSATVSLWSGKSTDNLRFQHKVSITIKNESAVDVVLRAGFFEFANGIEPHPLLGCTAGGRQAYLLFRGKDHHSEREFVLKAHQLTDTFTALSPKIDPAKIQELIDASGVGYFRFTGCWLGDSPATRHYRFPA